MNKGDEFCNLSFSQFQNFDLIDQIDNKKYYGFQNSRR